MSVYSILFFIGYLLLFLISFVLLVIIFPINISFQSVIDGLFYDFSVKISIILGMLKATIRIDPEEEFFKFELFSLPVYTRLQDREKTESEEEPEKETIEEKTEKPDKKRRRNFMILYKPLRRLLNSIINKIKIRYLDIDIIAGLSDPYISGMFFGTLYPFIEMLSLAFPAVSLNFTPLFVEDRFKSSIDGKISLIIILLVYPILRFLLSKEFREYRRQ